MELKEGMYVRTKYNGISKIVDYINDPTHYFFKCYKLDRDYINCEEHITEIDVLKASHNIIDLIEVGDYVNGVEIVEIDNDPFIKGQINLWTNIRNTNGFGDIEIIKIIDNEIKSIVTKEQFESMSYKVGE